MKKRKIKKIIFILILLVFLITSGIFLYKFIYSSSNKLQCTRDESGVLTIYDFEFDMFKNIKNITKKISFPYSNEESARYEYENNVVDKTLAKLDGKNIIYTIENEDIIYKTVEETKKMYTDFVYTCKVVKK